MNMKPVRDPNLIFVGMPTYNGMPLPPTQVLWDLFAEGKKIGPYTFIRRQCACYSSAKGRNILTAMAFSTAASKMLLIDSDMNAGPEQVLRILSHPETIVGGLYPKKELTLEPRWVASFIDAKRPDGMAECREVGGGFICVDLEMVRVMFDKFPGERYLCDDDQMRGEPMFNLWGERVAVDNWTLGGAGGTVWPRLLTDDYAFCWRARQAGAKIWCDTVCQIGHIGLVDFLQATSVLQKLLDLPADLESARSGGPREAGPALPRHT